MERGKKEREVHLAQDGCSTGREVFKSSVLTCHLFVLTVTILLLSKQSHGDGGEREVRRSG